MKQHQIAPAAGVTTQRQERGPVPVSANRTGLPDHLMENLESLSGFDLSGIRVHRDSGKPAQLNALAFARDNEIHLGPGQEQHLPHEAWHLVQQRQGRVKATARVAGVSVNDDGALEREADVMGARANASEGAGNRSTSGARTDASPRAEASSAVGTAQLVNAAKKTAAAKKKTAAAKKASDPKKGAGKTWTKAKAQRYREHLTRRVSKRIDDGKSKSVDKLLRRSVKARQLAEPSWKPKLADPPKAGHHVPPLAISNALDGVFAFGPRGSAEEKSRRRLYLPGASADRQEQHGLMHAAEALAGVDRNGAFSGTDKQLAHRILCAHAGLRNMVGQKLTAEVLSQHDREQAAPAQPQPLEAATRRVLAEKYKKPLPSVASDSTGSDPESDEDAWMTDSDEE